ncbi:hypothetical protein KDD17_16410 [Sulfitobacter albidus]|uniref:Uncharacterized protein n=1 Tax=Sulfitobacter albidus TaxID=2829501 RepID=A0A975PM52_9RHOB|nr:hypothetical protein [Sulfitobacter albidus]QUJ76442.1 hypothetical protein KDD17_16410 [Sulfitobacter albidus]
MELESVMLKLPRELLSGAQRVATAQDVTIGHLVRVLLKREVDRQLNTPKVPPDPRLIAALQALLATDMAAARDWEDLAVRLRPHGYALRLAAGELIVRKLSCGTRVCKASDLGMEYGDLVRRFGGPMPEHTHAMTHRGVMPAGKLDDRRHGLLSAQLAAATCWPDLIARLAREGMEMRALGAGLGIYVRSTGRHLCNTDAIGASYDALIARFGEPLPERGGDIAGAPLTATRT